MEKDLKDLLLKDLCARLPYSVKISVQSWDEREMEYTDKVDVLYSVNGDEYIKSVNEDYVFSVEDIKPYLFPLSSMTEEQKKEYKQFLEDIDGYAYSIDCVPQIDWLNTHHFDYRGLIERGLALKASEGMYN